jgi:hypothetical protein
VPENFAQTLWSSFRDWWRSQPAELSFTRKNFLLVAKLWEFVRESTPQKRRDRYGDMDYDWENRVNTTSGTVGWRERLLGSFHSPYQPTEPNLFHEMLASLPIECVGYTFIDLGSGKGRTLLMAADYPFEKIVGVELMAELHDAAQANILDFRNPAQRCHEIESILGDARQYDFPPSPLVLYLFNPLHMSALGVVLGRLQNSVAQHPRPVWVIYHNQLLEQSLFNLGGFRKTGGTQQYSIYTTHQVNAQTAPHHS